MGRGRGKGKKLTMPTTHEDQGSGEEEKIPTQKRRGRPQKPPLLKDEIDEEEMEKLELEDNEDKAHDKAKNTAPEAENGKKRRRSSQSQTKETPTSPVKEENEVVVVPQPNTDVSTKSNGFRHIGSRRKNKPRRAAEVGVECN